MSDRFVAESTQRLGAIADLPVLLMENGIDPIPVFAGTGLDPATITPDTRLPLPVVQDLLDRAVLNSANEYLCLFLGLRFTMAKHGPIGRLMQTAPTLRDALADYVSWQHGYSTGAIVYLTRVGDDAAFGFGVQVPRPQVSHTVYDFIAGVGVRIVAELTAGKAVPQEVHLSRRAPKTASPYARVLRCAIRFNRPLNGLILDSAALQTPLPTQDPVARRKLLATMNAAVGASGGYTAQVRRGIRRALLETAPRMTEGNHPVATACLISA